MNISDLRSFFNGSSASRSRAGEMAESQQSRTHQPLSGSSPAASYQPSQAAQRGSSIFSNALMSNLQSLGASGSNPPVATTSSESSQGSSFFDAEEVAKNVLTFVDRAIGAAKSRGASSAKLEEMMSQARSGIEKGFSQAREELGKIGMMNDALSEGIDKSYGLIGEGLDKIQDNLGSPNPTVFGQPAAGNVRGAAATYKAQMDYSLSKESSLTIRTRDGDEVNISFADITRFQQSHSQTAAYASYSNNGGGSGSGGSQGSEGGFAGLYQQEDTMSYYRALGFSFSVDGDLDEGEQEAIAKLVQDISELADEFFNGDLDKAWEQAQELGFDSSELSGFSLSMQRTESISVRESYSAVAQYGNEGASTEEGRPNVAQLLKPVDGYIKDFLSMLGDANNVLEDGEALSKLTDSTVGQYLQSQRPEILEDGLARFNQFNQNILGLLGVEQADKGASDASEPVGFVPQPEQQNQTES